MTTRYSIVALVTIFAYQSAILFAQERTFKAIGPDRITELEKHQLLGAVLVSFDLQPTQMSFDLPWHYCQVAENGLKIAHFAAETYDPRNWDGTGADASFEAGMDESARYARVWIEHQSPARIIVRVRYALTNTKLEIAHDDLPTGSPYNNGFGDWGEESFTIYPDGIYVRHMKINSGLASQSQPFGFYREPPNVVHEFMETVVIGPQGHVPTDDIQTDPTLTLIKMFDATPGQVYEEGASEDFSYELPEGPPSDFEDFRDANIMLLHTKSTYKPFTIGLPYGVAVSPYAREDDQRFPFATWSGYSEPTIGYVSAIGHMVNWWHFRRSETAIEQVYLHGFTRSDAPRSDLVRLAWSWITPPELQMPGTKLSANGSAGEYNRFTYDRSQRAYVISRPVSGPSNFRFVLDSIYDDEHLQGTMWLINPAFVILNWNSPETNIQLTIDDYVLSPGVDYRVGTESTDTGSNLVVWLHRAIDLNKIEDHSVVISLDTIAADQ